MRRTWAGLALISLLWANAPAAEPLYESLNVLERQAVDAALFDRGLVIDENPEGKRFGSLIVVNLDVFLDDQSYLEWANALHAKTKRFIIEDEALWEAGAPFDRALVEETTRNLRESVNFSVVALVPVQSLDPEAVDIMAVTRDTWSLRLSTQSDSADGVIDRLSVVATERNLAGIHKQVAAVFIYEQDTIQIGPQYLDPRLFRSRLRLTEQLLFAINHDNGDLEGTVHFFELALPLYSLATRWGFQVAESHDITVDRSFIGSRVRTYDNPDTAEVEAVPFEVDNREVSAVANALYGFGRSPRNVFSFGYGLNLQEYELIPSTDPVTRDAFERDVLPRSELASFLEGAHRFYEARYTAVRNYQTFALAEDILLGFDVVTRLRAAPEFLGSDTNHLYSSVTLGYTAVLSPEDTAQSRADGTVFAAVAGVGGRLQIDEGDTIDRFFNAGLHIATPAFGPFRLHVGGRTLVRGDRSAAGLEELGGTTGLRGFPAGSFIGETLAIGHFELRTLPLELLSLYFGLVLFFDAATIFQEGDEPPFLSDVGLGIRLLAPQLQRIVYRFDYAFPTSGPDDFFPGVFTIGVGQVF